MADSSDKFRYGASGIKTELSAPISDTDTELTPNSVVGMPTTTGIDITIDRVDSDGALTPSKIERIIGVVSGGDIVSLIRGVDGTNAQAHEQGAVIEMIPTGRWAQDLMDGLLVSLQQSGVLKAGAISSSDMFATGIVNSLALGTGVVIPSKLNLPYGRIYYSATGATGGQIIGPSATTMVFNTLDPDSNGVTSPTAGVLEVPETGVYKMSVHARIADAPQSTNIIWIEYSPDSGSTWHSIAERTPGNNMSLGRSLQNATVAYLEAGTQLRGRYFSGGGNTRIAAADADDQKYGASLVVGM